MYSKLICNLYALLCWQKFILIKGGCYTHAAKAGEVVWLALDLLILL
jgi:hypothetical protein